MRARLVASRVADAARVLRLVRARAAVRRRLGVSVSTERVSAVLLAGDRVRWSATRERAAAESLSDALAALLSALPRRLFARERATVAVGPATAQIARLRVTDEPSGPGPSREATPLDLLVQTHPQCYFQVNGTPLVVSGVRHADAGTAWAAAVPAPVVAEVVHGCRAARVRLAAIVPALVALERAVSGPRADVVDGGVQAAVTFEKGVIAGVRRCVRSNDVARGEPSLLVPVLESLGGRGHELAEAYGAARVTREERLALRGPSLALRSEPSRARLAWAALACGLALAVWLVLPGAAALQAARRDRRALAARARPARAAAESARALDRVTRELAEIEAFAASRISMTGLLADLTRALPEKSALTELAVDSAGTGTLVALAPRAAQVVDALEHVPGLASPAIVGPVTQETVMGQRLERVTVRFTIVPSGDAAAP